MAQIGLNIYLIGLSGKLIIRWVKASNPLAEVGRNANPSLLTFPYDDVYTIPDLVPVVYIVQLWRSDDGISLDQLIKDWSIDASKETRNSATTYQYKTDRGWTNITQATGSQAWHDPENGDIILEDERIDGFTKDQMLVHEAGYGNKLDAEYDLHPGGGIELLGGKTFDSEVAWFITVFSSEIVTIPQDSGNSEMFADTVVITEDRDFFIDSNDNLYRKLCLIEGSNPVLAITFGDLTLIPDGTHVLFNTHFGDQNYLKLQFDPGDTIKFFNQEYNILYLPKGEKIWLYFKGGKVHVLDYEGEFLKRGTVLQDYDINRNVDRGNLIEADESVGELNKSDYPGLYEFVEQLNGDAVCDLGSGVGQWSYINAGVYPNKRKYGIDTINEKFRVPHLTDITSKLGSTPGVYEAAQVGEINENKTDFKQGKSDDNESGVSGEYLRKPGASGGSNYGNVTVNFLFNSGKENKVKSFLQKAFIYL